MMNNVDAKKTRLAREEKMYYRLGLYKIDRLCSNETANLLKVRHFSGGLMIECVDSIGRSFRSIDL
jgi:hypothetical protein